MKVLILTVKQIIIGCGYSGRGDKTERESLISCAPKHILLLFMIFITRSHRSLTTSEIIAFGLASFVVVVSATTRAP